LLGVLLSDAALALASSVPSDRARAFDGWAVDRALGNSVRGLELDDAQAWRAVEVVRAVVALASIPRGAPEGSVGVPTAWFDDASVRAATGWNTFEGASYVNREAYGELLQTLAARDTVLGVPGSFTLALHRIAAAEATGYRVSESVATKEPVSAPVAPVAPAAPVVDDGVTPAARSDPDTPPVHKERPA